MEEGKQNSTSVCTKLKELYSNEIFWIFNIHLKCGVKHENTRVHQLRSTLNKLENIKTLIVGDFNDELDEDQKLFHMLKDKFLCHHTPKTAYNGDDWIAVDRVVSEGLKISNIRTIVHNKNGIPNKNYWTWSDHLPLFFTLNM